MLERDDKLVLSKTGRSLATLTSDPRLMIDAATRINSEIYSIFDIEKFLIELNEKLFKIIVSFLFKSCAIESF